MKLPEVWNEPFTDYIEQQLRLEAARWFRIHQLPDDREAWLQMREVLHRRILSRLGSGVDHQLPLDVQETGSIEMDGYVVRHVCYQSRPGFYVTGNLYIPEGEGPFPGVICMHGHWTQGRLAERVQARGHSLAKNGYVVLLVDAFGSGERSTIHGEFEYHGAALGASLLDVGETLMGMQIVDNMRGVDLLCSLDFVDSGNIGATGASGGGNQTMWLAALDERVKAAVPVVSVGSFESYVAGVNCVCEMLPDGLTIAEESGVLALIAPRALKICNCLGDSNPTFFPSEMLRSYKEARIVYQACGGDDKLSYQIFNQPHGYWPEIREAMLGWFDLHLKGVGTGAPKQEKPFDSLPESDLMVFEKGKRPGKVASISEFCRDQGEILKKQFMGIREFDQAAKKQELREILKTFGTFRTKNIHAYSRQGMWQRFALESDDGRMTPVLFRPPEDDKLADCVIAAAPEGKHQMAALASLDSVLADGQGVLLADLWGTGETSVAPQRSVRVAHHELARASIWLGRTMMGEWVRDYQLLFNFLNEHLRMRHISFYGYRECGVAALFAAALTDNVSEVFTEQAPVSWVFKSPLDQQFFSLASHLPRLLCWGDVSLAAALTNVPVEFSCPVHVNGSPVAPEEMREVADEFDAVKTRCCSRSQTTFKR